MDVSLIWAMTQNRVIGKNGQLPWHLPDEMAYFRKTTLCKTIIMGRKTFESMGCKPLPRRTNIVLTRSRVLNASHDDVVIANSLERAFQLAQKTNVAACFVIGGSQIYEAALPFANLLYQTVIATELEGDTYFPEFDVDQWELLSSQSHATDAQHEFAFETSILKRKPNLG